MIIDFFLLTSKFNVENYEIMKRVFSIRWLLKYKKKNLSADALAGLLLSIILIPQSMAYAVLCGVPPYIGLFANFLPMVIYSFFGTSKYLSVGPFPITSIMTLNAVAALAHPGNEEYLPYVITLTFMVGLVFTLMAIFRLGFLEKLLDPSVLIGFLSGSAVIIILSQLKLILGVKGGVGSGWEILVSIVEYSGTLNWYSISMAIFSIVSIISVNFIIKRFCMNYQKISFWIPKIMPMIVVFLCSMTVFLFDMDHSYGVKIIGLVPEGFPELRLPEELFIKELIIPAFMIALINFIGSISVVKSLDGTSPRAQIKPNKELLALGMSNIVSSLSGSIPVTGGLARSAVNYSAGAKTQLSGIVAAVILAIVLYKFTALCYYIPLSVLAMMVIYFSYSLISFKNWKSLMKNKYELAAAIITLIAVLVMGPTASICIMFGISLLFKVKRLYF